MKFEERQKLINDKTRQILETLHQWVGELARQLDALQEKMENDRD